MVKQLKFYNRKTPPEHRSDKGHSYTSNTAALPPRQEQKQRTDNRSNYDEIYNRLAEYFSGGIDKDNIDAFLDGHNLKLLEIPPTKDEDITKILRIAFSGCIQYHYNNINFDIFNGKKNLSAQPEEYDLNSSPVWQKFALFPELAKLDKLVKQSLSSHQIDPDNVSSLSRFDICKLISDALAEQKDVSTSPSTSTKYLPDYEPPKVAHTKKFATAYAKQFKDMLMPLFNSLNHNEIKEIKTKYAAAKDTAAQERELGQMRQKYEIYVDTLISKMQTIGSTNLFKHPDSEKWRGVKIPIVDLHHKIPISKWAYYLSKGTPIHLLNDYKNMCFTVKGFKAGYHEMHEIFHITDGNNTSSDKPDFKELISDFNHRRGAAGDFVIVPKDPDNTICMTNTHDVLTIDGSHNKTPAKLNSVKEKLASSSHSNLKREAAAKASLDDAGITQLNKFTRLQNYKDK